MESRTEQRGRTRPPTFASGTTSPMESAMITSPPTDIRPAAASVPRAAAKASGMADSDVLGALMEALGSPERYRLIERGGEVHIEPVK